MQLLDQPSVGVEQREPACILGRDAQAADQPVDQFEGEVGVRRNVVT